MAGPKDEIQYVSDNGTTYRMKMDAGNAAAVGAVAAAGTERELGKRMRPRYVLAQHPSTGVQRKLVIPNISNPIWPASGGTLTIEDFSVSPSSLTTGYLLKGRIGEKRLA
jgi:hypothetical protein